MSITGIGTVTGYGWSTTELWDGLLSGKPAAELTGGLGPDGRDEGWVARVPSGGDPADGDSLFTRALRAACREAVADAHARGWRPGARVGVLHATVYPEVEAWRDFHRSDRSLHTARGFITQMPSTSIALMMKEFGFHGPSMSVAAMCSSGNAGLITAKMWLDAGVVDDVLLVSTDLSLTPDTIESFIRMGVAVADTDPLDASRPFQEGSRGFGLGEASVAMVVTNRPTDGRYARMWGGAMTHDAFHVVSIDPSHEQVLGCVSSALESSGVAPEEIRYLNAHGPGTAQCTAAETEVLARSFGDRPQVYSVKPLVGHCQGAAAGVEIAVAAMSYDAGVIPASPQVAPGHPRLLDGVTTRQPGLTMKTSLGMGGHNAAVVLGEI
ncbi:beta-ketoacyl synthase N-terminal-like domain-containing protein [Williamsia sp. CHRR-6]|uniref:beta-ketoacyl synthase N-terminal-like domain-containing protein n=1 Tax=Williamsia sp. CHRR-6 TaxID=2835871 RepID=UPI0027DB6D8D|nr:beta-ketoacyl synthase N-terminal-like domain-containing protein [Williamsia sp. CHRR-6]